MKPIYNSYTLQETMLRLTASLFARSTDGTSETLTPIPAESLDTLRVELIEPNVSGARDLIKSGKCAIDDNKVTIKLRTNDWLKGGVYRLQCSAIFGTQTEVFCVLDIAVPRYTELSDTELDIEVPVLVVSTVGGSGGGGGGADATVYALDGNGNAYITKPLSVSGSVREGQNTIASGGNSHAEGNGTTASGQNSHAEGNTTTASGAYSHAEGSNTNASQLNSHAEGNSTTASGDYSHAEGIGATASGQNSHAEGNSTTASGTNSHAEGQSTRAVGINSHAEGSGTVAQQTSQHVCGQFNVIDTSNSYQFIVGNGTGEAERHNAFAVTKSGELALFEADGTPVILSAANLEALIASLS